MRRNIKVSITRPNDWPEQRVDANNKYRVLPLEAMSWTDAWGTHELKDDLLKTQYSDPAPVSSLIKRKYRGG